MNLASYDLETKDVEGESGTGASSGFRRGSAGVESGEKTEFFEGPSNRHDAQSGHPDA